MACSDDFAEACLTIMQENDWNMPESATEAINLYEKLFPFI